MTRNAPDPADGPASPDPLAGREASKPESQGGTLDVAPRRTLMAAERTYLAWFRTGLGAIGVSLAVGRLVPVLLGGPHLGYALLGIGYGLLGLFLTVYAAARARRLEAAVTAGDRVSLDRWALLIATVGGVVLGLATMVLVVLEA